MSQTNIGTVSKATLGTLLRDGVERTCELSRALKISSSELHCNAPAFRLPVGPQETTRDCATINTGLLSAKGSEM